jgi:membrane-associated phospholipid phosphatase
MVIILFSTNYIAIFTPPNVKWLIVIVTFVFTFLLPLLNSIILLKTGRIQSLEMETRQERIIPYAGAVIYHFALSYLFYKAHFPFIFQVLILGVAVAILVTLLITFFWKISAHAIGVAGIVGALLGIIYRLQINLFSAFMLFLFIAGAVGYARLKLNAHTPAQVYTGFALGFIIEFSLMLFIR